MADMYSIVKKQDEKIDDLLKIAKENKELLTDIDTRLASAPEQPSAEPAVPDKIQVELPASIATNESVKRLVEAALAKQKIEALKSLDFSQFPKELAEAFAKAFKDGLEKNVKNALHDGIRNEFTNQITGLNESAKRLTDRMYSIVNGAIWAAIPNRCMPLPEPYCLSQSVSASGAIISTRRTSIFRKSNGSTATSV